MTSSQALFHVRVGDGICCWSNGYTGDAYFATGTTLTMTLPAGTSAFYFYVQPNAGGAYAIEAVAQDGTTSGPVAVSSAQYFGFYGTGGATISSITVTAPAAAGGFAVGEFGVGLGAQQLLSELLAAVQGVGPGTSLADKVTQAQSYLASGDVTDACSALGGFINEVRAQSGKSIPPAQAATLVTDAQQVKVILGC